MPLNIAPRRTVLRIAERELMLGGTHCYAHAFVPTSLRGDELAPAGADPCISVDGPSRWVGVDDRSGFGVVKPIA